MKEQVHHPMHYQHGNYECIEVLRDVLSDLNGIEAFCIGNAFKYLWRFKDKNGVEDLEKCKWYIEYLIGNVYVGFEDDDEEENKKSFNSDEIPFATNIKECDKALEDISKLSEEDAVALTFLNRLYQSFIKTNDVTYLAQLSEGLLHSKPIVSQYFYKYYFN